MSTKDYRDVEIQKLVEQAFMQFGIVDEAEKLDLTSSIKKQLNSNDILSHFTSSMFASSSKYRSDIRAVLIDIIAQLLHARDMDLKIKQLEGTSRQLEETAKAKINSLEKTIIQQSENIRESFEEQVDSGTHSNTMTRDGFLRVAKLGTLSKLSNPTITVSPAESIQDEVSVAVSGELEHLYKTGAGSDSYWIRVVSPVIPEFFENNRLVKGAIVALELDAVSTNTLPIMASVKGSGFFRIFSLEGSTNKENWDFLGSDPTYGEHSFVEIEKDINYSYYRLKLHIPSAEVDNGFYFYNLGLHNIKIFNKKQDTERIIGNFESYVYTADDPLFKVKFDAEFKDFCNFKIKFKNRTDIQPIAVLPKDTKLAKIFKYYDPTDGDTWELPFKWKEGTSYTLTSSNGTEYSDLDDMSTDDNSNISSLTLPTDLASKFIFLEYEVEDNSKHEALLTEATEITDEHDYKDGYIFNLSQPPWIIAEYGDNFTINLSNSTEIITDISDYKNPVEFTDESAKQFYYYNNRLYTNFNMMASSQTITVTYQSMCAGVSLDIELADYAKVDSYNLDLVTIANPVYTEVPTETNSDLPSLDPINNSTST